MKDNHSRFGVGLPGGKGGVITCVVCGAKTRDTGHDEESFQQCRFCIEEAETINLYEDGELSDKEYKEAMADIAARRKAADEKKEKRK